LGGTLTTNTSILSEANKLIFTRTAADIQTEITSNQITVTRTGDSRLGHLSSTDLFFQTLGGDGLIFTAQSESILININTGSPQGLVYNADYSANYTNRSLTDKEYVDNVASGLLSDGSGTTVNSGAVDLGGTLTSPVEIVGSEIMSFGLSGNRIDGFFVYTDGGINLIAEQGASVSIQVNDSNQNIGIVNNGANGEIVIESGGSGGAIFIDSSSNFEATCLNQTIQLSASGMSITDNANNKGLVYVADYSSNFTDRSLIDKAYVDTLVGVGFTFENGITESANTVKLGGDLTTNTIIERTNGSFAFQINDVNTTSYIDLLGSEISVVNDAGVNPIKSTLTHEKLTLSEELTDIVTIEKLGSSLEISSTLVNFQGAVYDVDYSADYVDRSLVDKEYVDVQISGSGGRTWRENGVDLPERTGVNFLTNGNGTLMTDDGIEDETEVDLQFALNTDVDMTGVQDGGIPNFSLTSSKYEPVSVAPFQDILLNTEANLSADGLLSIIKPAGYDIYRIILKETSSNAAGNVSVGSTALGTDIVNAVTVGVDADLSATLGITYFSSVNDTDLYISSSAWGSGVVQIYFTFIKVI
jgi:hypothetical protein